MVANIGQTFSEFCFKLSEVTSERDPVFKITLSSGMYWDLKKELQKENPIPPIQDARVDPDQMLYRTGFGSLLFKREKDDN